MLIFEPGEGLTNSNSYVALVDADAYFADRNRTAWAAAATAAREGALIRATDYIDSNYRFGDPKTATQALMWPQVDQLGIPAALRKAVMELALIALTEDLIAPTGKEVASEEKSLGSMSTKTTYSIPEKPGDRFEAISAILSRLARPRSSSVAEVRLLP